MSPPPPAHAPSGRSTNPFDDDADDSDDYDDETISRMLDNMDIDADFNCWTSFRASMSIKSKNSLSSVSGQPHGASIGTTPHSGTVGAIREQEEEEMLTKSEQAYIDKWSRRVDREEVYFTTYRPVPREEREVKDLAAFLGVTGGGGSTGATKQAGGAGGLLDKMNMGNLVSLQVRGQLMKKCGQPIAHAFHQVESTLMFVSHQHPLHVCDQCQHATFLSLLEK